MSRTGFQQLEVSDPTRDVNHGVGTGRAELQLHNQAEVSQAHQFFQPLTDAPLPNLKLGGPESSLLSAHQATAALAQAGGEPVSPLVQLIMRMPGLTGVMNSLFELIGSILHGNLLDALNPALFAEHAGEAVAAFQSTLQHVQISLDILHAQTPSLHFDGNGFTAGDTMPGMQMHQESLAAAADAHAANVGAPIQQVDLKHAVFEKETNVADDPQYGFLDPLTRHNSISLGDSSAGVYAPSHGGVYQPLPSAPAAAAGPAPQQPAALAGTPSPASGGEHLSFTHAMHHAHMHHLETAHNTTELAQQPPPAATPSSESSLYTVHHGDSLWDIARKHLGDPSRWHEIYQMNANAIGGNPNLIHGGLSLKLPDGAANQYVVQPGDNLWNIARHQLGGGQRWSEIYKINHDAIGNNPNLIHPGQHFSLGGSEQPVLANDASDPTVFSPGAADSAVSQPVSLASAPAHAPATTAHAMAQPEHAALKIAQAPKEAVQEPAEAAHQATPAQDKGQVFMSEMSQTPAVKTPVADHTAIAESYPHSSAGSVQAETPVLAPLDAAASAQPRAMVSNATPDPKMPLRKIN